MTNNRKCVTCDIPTVLFGMAVATYTKHSIAAVYFSVEIVCVWFIRVIFSIQNHHKNELVFCLC